MSTQALTTTVPEELIIAKKQSALSRLFTLKPSTIELVSKSSQQEGVTPGMLRNTATNEHFSEMRVVMLYEPQEQRALFKKGEYSKDAKICFSLTNVSPHPAAKEPKSLYCDACPMGDIAWKTYRDAKKKGVTGEALSALKPPCGKYWHLFIADRNTKAPHYLNVRGLSVSAFEAAAQNFARIFALMISNTRLENKKIAEYNAANPADQKPLVPLPQSVSDVIWKIVFTIYVTQPIKGGQYALGFRDFAVMKPEDYAEFGTIISDIAERRAAGTLQSQAEAEAETTAGINVAEEPASNATSEVAQKNSQIVI
jgi:hypothetical protein